jgi:hypothetical protein
VIVKVCPSLSNDAHNDVLVTSERYKERESRNKSLKKLNTFTTKIRITEKITQRRVEFWRNLISTKHNYLENDLVKEKTLQVCFA